MEAHHELVQAGVRVTVPTVEGTLRPNCDGKGRDVQVQTT